MTKLFISYRREDSAPWAGRVYERLVRDFKRGDLFMDVDDIPPGADFVKVLDQRVAACDVMLVIIGPTWATTTNRLGQHRLHDPHDFVRIEIESALRRDIRVVPLLVGGAKMPLATDLPESLKGLLQRQAIELTHERFGSDTAGLIARLGGVNVARNTSSAKRGWLSLPPLLRLFSYIAIVLLVCLTLGRTSFQWTVVLVFSNTLIVLASTIYVAKYRLITEYVASWIAGFGSWFWTTDTIVREIEKYNTSSNDKGAAVIISTFVYLLVFLILGYLNWNKPNYT